MSLVSMKELLKDADKHGYAVGQFNIMTLEFAETIAKVAAEQRSPLIFGAGEPTIQYIGLKSLVKHVEIIASKHDIPIALHLDHGSSFEIAVKAMYAGFSSIMYDGSQLPLNKNIEMTNKIKAVADVLNVSLEGEVGVIGGIEEGVNNSNQGLANIDDALLYWNETNVDALALAVGTAHGMYTEAPKINLDLIRSASQQINGFLVLHGGSGVLHKDIEKAIKAGIRKINVNTENCVAYTNEIRDYLIQHPSLTDPRAFHIKGREAIEKVVTSKIQLFGSNNRI
ncbi:class II fructose-bisphosphate aldolase [Gracilibacillus alcaliphilus]|uniref:class II fructose-bisphosphate aldolase n=1 Tax=Gracilibacillus alcaliphilus TaxID=1401441 RepID=UPI001EF78AE4|nr:class II fructose-bisphosphate aldolase [Gracilibacillus alcaliphilus]MBM7677159.1 fructose-bisphosphate aldolase class II [Gracilibacillus alcaliphilus]